MGKRLDASAGWRKEPGQTAEYYDKIEEPKAVEEEKSEPIDDESEEPETAQESTE